jgi:DNA-binding XRE family transcriptional regulator
MDRHIPNHVSGEIKMRLSGKKKINKNRGLSQNQMIVIVGIKPAGLSRLEGDRYEPSVAVPKSSPMPCR